MNKKIYSIILCFISATYNQHTLSLDTTGRVPWHSKTYSTPPDKNILESDITSAINGDIHIPSTNKSHITTCLKKLISKGYFQPVSQVSLGKVIADAYENKLNKSKNRLKSKNKSCIASEIGLYNNGYFTEYFLKDFKDDIFALTPTKRPAGWGTLLLGQGYKDRRTRMRYYYDKLKYPVAIGAATGIAYYYRKPISDYYASTRFSQTSLGKFIGNAATSVSNFISRGLSFVGLSPKAHITPPAQTLNPNDSNSIKFLMIEKQGMKNTYENKHISSVVLIPEKDKFTDLNQHKESQQRLSFKNCEIDNFTWGGEYANNIILEDCNIKNFIFSSSRSSLANSIIQKCTIENMGGFFRNSDIYNVTIKDSTINRTNNTKLFLRDSKLINSTLENGNFAGSWVHNSLFKDVNFNTVTFSKNADGGEFMNTTFDNIKGDVIFEKMDFTDCTFKNIDFNTIEFKNCTFKRCKGLPWKYKRFW